MTAPAQLIEDAVVAAIVAAGISGLGSSAVLPRDQPEVAQGDPSPVCVVVVGNDRYVERDNQQTFLSYPVLVVLAKKTALSARKSDSWWKEARYSVFGALYKQRLLGSGGICWRCEYDSNPEWSPQGFPQDYRSSAQRFSYIVQVPSPD